MTEFPRLSRGSYITYPVTRGSTFRTQVVRFMDGSEQRFRDSARPARRWVISLELLREDEISALAEFIDSLSGGFGTFSFIDPWDGTLYPECRVAGETFDSEYAEENRVRTRLVVMEMGDN